MKLDLTVDHYLELMKKSYSLDMLYMLKLIHKSYDVNDLCEISVKMKAIYTSLLRKGLITEENNLTVLGLDILEFVSKKTNKTLVKKKPLASDFDEWWEVYPSTDYFKMGNKTFLGSRAIRINKQKCKLEFDKIIGEGNLTKKDIIIATEYDVKQRKSNSLKKNSNQLTYMQNSLTYLNQRSFEPFIALSKKLGGFGDDLIIGSFNL